MRLHSLHPGAGICFHNVTHIHTAAPAPASAYSSNATNRPGRANNIGKPLPVIAAERPVLPGILKKKADVHHDILKGISLLEVLIALLIITIITGLAAVSIGPFWKKHQLQHATGHLLEQIQVCRMKAIVEQKTYQIKITGQTLYRRSKTGMDWSNWEAHQLDGPSHVSMKGTSYFYSKGFASPKTITVIHDEYRQKIIININGRARVSDVY